MFRKPPSAIISFKCPRCRRACEVVRYGDVTFEYCRSCAGLFLDKEELAEKVSSEDKTGGPRQTQDAAQCPKCGTTIKNAAVKKRGIALDLCPGSLCSGIRFDREKYRQSLKQKPGYYSAGLYCESCGRESKFVLAEQSKDKRPVCPSCGHFQNFLLHPQRSAKKAGLELAFAFAVFVLIAVLVFLNRSAIQARFYTFAAEQSRSHAGAADEEKSIMENRRAFGEKNARACGYYKKAYALRPASIDKSRAAYAAEACGYADMPDEQRFFSELYRER